MAEVLDKATRIKELKKKKSELIKQRMEAEDKDWAAEAQGVMDKMAKEFPNGWDFLTKAKTYVLKDLHVVAPNGRVRNLWRSITGKAAIKAAAGRRATNSPIQGFASEIGTTTAFLIMRNVFRVMRKLKIPMKYFIRYCRAVHDANYYNVPYCMTIVALHVIQYTATYGVAQWYEQVFKFKFQIEPEIELDIGSNDADMFTWDWSLDNLAECIFFALKQQAKDGAVEDSEIKSIVRTIVKPWKNLEHRAYLQENYPLLGVKDLDSQIDGFLTKILDHERMEESWKKYLEKKSKK